MPSPPLPEAIEKTIRLVVRNGRRDVDLLRRAIAAAIENTMADTFQIMVDGLSLSGKQVFMIQALTGFVEQHRKNAAALEAGEK